MRLLVVFDGNAWFVRRVRVIEHDLERDEKVYRCDQHVGGPFATLEELALCLREAKPSVRHSTVEETMTFYEQSMKLLTETARDNARRQR